MNNGSQWLNNSAGARTEQLRRLAEWRSRRDGQPLNAYSATQEAYTSGVVAGRVAAVDAGCCVGDFYMVGRYATNPLAIFDSNGLRSDVSLNSVNGNNTIYLLKYNRNGIAQWGAKIGSSTTNTSNTPIVVSAGSDVYVCGIVTGTQLRLYNADDETTPVISLTLDASINKIWLAKYSSDGVAQWATYVSDSSTLIRPYVAVDSTSNVYLAGRFSSTMQIYQAGLTQAGTLTSTDALGDNFLIKYNSAGAYQWSTKIGGLGNDTTPNVLCDHDDNVYISAVYTSPLLSVYNAGGALAFTIGNDGFIDNYLVKYNSSGTALWGTHIGGTRDDTITSIAVDRNNNVYISAPYLSVLVNIYNPGNVLAFTLPNTDPTGNTADVYVAKYNPSGIAQWATRVGSVQTELNPCLTTDTFNNVFVSGLSSATQLSVYNSGNQATSALTLTPLNVSSSNPIVFLVKYNTNGIASWVTRVENVNVSDSTRLLRPIITSDGTNTYLTSVYDGLTLNIYDADNSLGRTLPGVAGTNTFIVKYDAQGDSQWVANTLSSFNPNIHTTF